MADPVLHLLAGPNGAGKSSLHELVIGPVTGLPFVNADIIAAETWPDDPMGHSYDAAVLAAERRTALMATGTSFVTETVFSHPSKLSLVHEATSAGYLVTLHVVMIPADLAVARVASRVAVGGHDVPEAKVRERWTRLWTIVVPAIALVQDAVVYDNSRADDPLRVVARFHGGSLVGDPAWPVWAPAELREAGR